MPSRGKVMKILALLFLAFFLYPASCAPAAEAPPAETTAYILDDSLGVSFALYPAPGYRSFVAKELAVSSRADLESRARLLPAGTRIYWSPYKRDPAGRPLLFSSADDAARFEKFCRDRQIDLIVDAPAACTESAAIATARRNPEIAEFCAAPVNGERHGCSFTARRPSGLNADEKSDAGLAWIVAARAIHSFDDQGQPRFMPEGTFFAHISAACAVKATMGAAPAAR